MNGESQMNPVRELAEIKIDAPRLAAFGFQSGLLSVRRMSREDQEFVRVTLRNQTAVEKATVYISHPIKRLGYRPPKIWMVIRAHARAHAQFTALDLCPPLTVHNAKQNCRRLVTRGELIRIRRGGHGRGAEETLYSLSRGTSPAGVARFTAPASHPQSPTRARDQRSTT